MITIHEYIKEKPCKVNRNHFITYFMDKWIDYLFLHEALGLCTDLNQIANEEIPF